MEDTVNIREITLNDEKAIQNIRKAISEDDGEVNFEKIIGKQLSEDSDKSSLVAEIDGLWSDI